MQNLTKISVVIAVKNEIKTIKKCLDSVLALDYPDFEVIVVDNNSTDYTFGALETYGDKIKILSNTIPGPSASRNMAIKAAKGKYIAFTDGDCIVDKNWLTELMKGFEVELPDLADTENLENSEILDEPVVIKKFEPNADDSEYLNISTIFKYFREKIVSKVSKFFPKNDEYCAANSSVIVSVGGRQDTPEDESIIGKRINKIFNLFSWCIDYFKKSQDIIRTKHNPTCNVIYKKEIFEKVGCFREDFWPGEDVEFDYRVARKGFAIMYNPNAVVCHYRPDTYEKFLKMMAKYGASQAFLIWLHGCFRLLHYLGLAGVFFLLFFLFITFDWFFYMIFIIAALFFIYLLVLERNIKETFTIYYMTCVAIVSWFYGFVKVLITRKFGV